MTLSSGRGILRRVALAAALVTALLAHSTLPAGASTFGEVVASIAAGDFEAADANATALDRSRGGEGDFFRLYVEASRLALTGRCEEAEPLIGVLINAEPAFVPARELSYLCLSTRGRNDEAARELASIVGILPDGPERDTFNALLESVRSLHRPVVSAYAEMMPSSNVNRQTAANQIGGLAIAPNSRGAAGVTLQGGVSVTQHLLTLGDVGIAGRLRADLAYSTWSALLQPQLTLETPMRFGGLKNVQIAVTPMASVAFAATNVALVRLGVRAAGVIELPDAQSLGLSAAVYRDIIPSAPRRSGWLLEGTMSWSAMLDPATRLTALAGADFDATDIVTRQVLDLSVGVRLDHITAGGLILGGQGTVGWRGHSRPPPLSTGPNQSDIYVALRGEVGHRDIVIGAGPDFPGVTPRLYYEYTRRWSDNVFFEFESHDVGVTLRTSF